MTEYYSEKTNFFAGTNPHKLVQRFGSPLYVYNERILRERCREIRELISYPNYVPNYSAKANSSLQLLKIIRSEGLNADAVSPGEIQILLNAGYKPDEILYISNNVSTEEMGFAVEKGVLVCIDSLSQLESFGRNWPGERAAVRFNPGIGAGHHEKVVTAGKKTKFGVNIDYIKYVKEILKKYQLKLSGINQHIGSLFMEGTPYLDGVKSLLDIAGQFDDLDFIDLGGGFGTPYHKQEGQERFNLGGFGEALDALLFSWSETYGKKVTFKVEPGRYIVAECGVLLGTVHAVKQNYGVAYAGTDLGFNVLARPVMYDSHHDVELYREGRLIKDGLQRVNIVGNICESGDYLAKDRSVPKAVEGDLVGVMDAGAYGYVMSSNYNSRLRPAEVLITADGEARLIRRRDTIEDLLRSFEV